MSWYGSGCKLGRMINNKCNGSKSNKPTREERKEIRGDNMYSTLHGRDSLKNLTDYEKKSLGYWD